MVKKALKVLNKIELLVIYITFGGMIFAAFAQVIFRLILKSPLAWSEEVCRYCFVWLVFLGGGWAVSGDAHFRVDFMIALFPKTENSPLFRMLECLLLEGSFWLMELVCLA